MCFSILYLCILISFPCILAPSPLGYEGRMQGKKINKRNGYLYIGIFLITQVHWSQTQFLEDHSSTHFSSNPNQTHMIQLIKVCRITRNFQAGVIWSWLKLNSASLLYPHNQGTKPPVDLHIQEGQAQT